MAADNRQVESHAGPRASARTLEIVACRGCEGGCRFALDGGRGLAAEIERAAAGLDGFTVATEGQVDHRSALSRIRVALSACPNGCSMPQIRDVGLIADRRPDEIGPDCTGCGCCEEACREGAVVMRAGQAILDDERCVGCGMCIRACPAAAIASEQTRWRVLAGGRMGRRPRLADEIGRVERAYAAAVVVEVLEVFVSNARPGERIGHVAERMGTEKLREIVQR